MLSTRTSYELYNYPDVNVDVEILVRARTYGGIDIEAILIRRACPWTLAIHKMEEGCKSTIEPMAAQRILVRPIAIF